MAAFQQLGPFISTFAGAESMHSTEDEMQKDRYIFFFNQKLKNSSQC